MFSRRLLPVSQPPISSVCLFCAAQGNGLQFQTRPFTSTGALLGRSRKSQNAASAEATKDEKKSSKSVRCAQKNNTRNSRLHGPVAIDGEAQKESAKPKTLKEALLGDGQEKRAKKGRKPKKQGHNLPIEVLSAEDLHFQPIDVKIPPVPQLSYGLDRVLFNPGVYRLQDPRSRVYNFDPYLEKIMPVNEFDFDALNEYKTSSKDEDLLAIARHEKTKFTGSTSSMSAVLQHFHYLLSSFRPLNHEMLSRKFPEPSEKFSKITLGPSAIFLRRKDDVYAIDADKFYDKPNIMSWLGHSLEKLLTTDRGEFERYRRTSPEQAPSEDQSARCYHYSKLGNFLMRSQLDAHDPRLPGSGIFDLKTRAVVSIRMNHMEYETGLGYQIRYDQGEWESYEREFYDMTRATMLKYSLQVRMGRMDGIFVAYHNIERIFGFQYLSLPDLDNVLHGQVDTTLGDQEFKLSINLLDELLQRATTAFPNTSIRLHFDTRPTKTSFMYIFAEPVTEEQADAIQNNGRAAYREFERNIVGVNRDDPEVQAEWQAIQDQVDEEVDEDEMKLRTEDEESSKANNEEGSSEAQARDIVEDKLDEAVQFPDTTEPSKSASDAPLMGWTLTIRNQVNGQYVDRPTNFTSSDNWTIEYHIQEIALETRWTIYSKLKERRRKLIGLENETEARSQLQSYRELIRKYTDKGRKWRQQQDQVDEGIGQRIYRPLGPGSEEATQAS